MTGVIAGFALTIVVLLLSRPSESAEGSDDFGRRAIDLFVATFYTSLLASFLFAVTAAEQRNEVRAYFLLLPPAFLFAVSAILLLLGLAMLARAYGLWSTVQLSQIIALAVIVVAIYNYNSTVADVVAVMQRRAPRAVYAQYAWGLHGIPFVALTLGIVRLLRDRNRRRITNTRSLPPFLITVVGICTVMSFSLSPMSTRDVTESAPLWQVLIFAPALWLIGVWAVSFIPSQSVSLPAPVAGSQRPPTPRERAQPS